MTTLVNRAKVSTATTGTGAITLGAAEPAFQTFADAGVVDGQVVRYVIEDGTDWEIGNGTYTAAGTSLSRSVIESSNSDAALNLSGNAKVYVTATADSFTALGVVTADSVQFNGGTGTEGTVSWNDDDKTLDIVEGGTTLQIGQETVWHVRNNTGATIPSGTPVMATGTIGMSGRITIAPMDGTNPANVKFLLGIATEDIAAGADGKVTHFGKVRGIDTSAFSEGDVLYIDTATAGQLTATEPTSGMNVPVAFVVSVSANVGTVAVRVTPIDLNLFIREIDGGSAATVYDASLSSIDGGSA